MTEKTVIYCKQNGGKPVPLTVRIQWSPDGTITPALYWTPDGTCYKVIYHAPAVHLAVLKERGEGLRFAVRSEIIETKEPHSELLHTRYDTYLYLADRSFSEKNIIDSRYKHAQKEYITVVMDVFADGEYELVYFWVRQNRYMVEGMSKKESRGSFAAGGIGIRHQVTARLVNADDDEDPDPLQSVRRPAALYLELNKWFVPCSPIDTRDRKGIL